MVLMNEKDNIQIELSRWLDPASRKLISAVCVRSCLPIFLRALVRANNIQDKEFSLSHDEAELSIQNESIHTNYRHPIDYIKVTDQNLISLIRGDRRMTQRRK